MNYFDIQYDLHVSNGEKVCEGTTLFTLKGDSVSILRVERLTLNLLSHLCGIATETSEYAALAHEGWDEEFKKDEMKVKPPKIACTRKTIPGLRKFEKTAVLHGGGDTHRKSLADSIMIKDNHIEILGLEKAVKTAKQYASFTQKIEVEVETPDDALLAAVFGADIVMLDNMEPEEIKKTLTLLEEKGMREKVIIEASGGITKNRIAEYAKTGVDVISVSSVITQAQWIDIGLDIIS